MTPGPLDDRMVGFVIPAADYPNMTGGYHVVYVGPNGTTHVTRVAGDVEAGELGVPVGTETELGDGVGDYGFSNPATLRAYSVDGTLLDEETYG